MLRWLEHAPPHFFSRRAFAALQIALRANMATYTASITHLTNVISCHALSPDGNLLAVCPNSTQVILLERSGGSWRVITKLEGHDQVCGAALAGEAASGGRVCARAETQAPDARDIPSFNACRRWCRAWTLLRTAPAGCAWSAPRTTATATSGRACRQAQTLALQPAATATAMEAAAATGSLSW